MEHSYDLDRYMGEGAFGKPKLSEEEIRKYEIPNDLSEVDRSLVLIKKTNATQRTSVLINLPAILKEHPEAEEELLPKIYQEVLSWDDELQTEGGLSLAKIIETQKLSEDAYQKLYGFILESLESWNNAKWHLVYQKFIENLDNIEPSPEKRKEIIDNGIKLSLSLIELSQAIPSRCTGTRVLAMLSNVIDKEVAK